MTGVRRGPNTYVWDIYSVERLKGLWGTMSAADIAQEMGCGLTSNSIIGKMRRIRAMEKYEAERTYQQRRSRRAEAITEDEREKIIGGVVEMHKRGTQPAQIGERYRIRAQLVRRLLRQEGYAVKEPDYRTPGHSDPMWDMSDDERRIEIIRRAGRGARAALAAIG